MLRLVDWRPNLNHPPSRPRSPDRLGGGGYAHSDQPCLRDRSSALNASWVRVNQASVRTRRWGRTQTS